MMLTIEEQIERLKTERCVICKGKAITYHHIIPKSQGGDWFEEDNLAPLCAVCHDLVHKNRKKYEPLLGDGVRATVKRIKKDE
jgi:5-methylcytosine-specific restriction endonuclease McrA